MFASQFEHRQVVGARVRGEAGQRQRDRGAGRGGAAVAARGAAGLVRGAAPQRREAAAVVAARVAQQLGHGLHGAVAHGREGGAAHGAGGEARAAAPAHQVAAPALRHGRLHALQAHRALQQAQQTLTTGTQSYLYLIIFISNSTFFTYFKYEIK